MPCDPPLLGERHRDDGQATLHLNPVQIAARDEVAKRLRSGAWESRRGRCYFDPDVVGEVLALKDRYGLPVTTRICPECGLVYTDPQLTEGAYGDFYEAYQKPLHVGADHPPDTYLFQQEARGRRIVDFVRRCEPISGRMLEVGAAAGGIVKAFANAGFEASGIDYDSDYLRFGQSQGIDLHVGTLRDLPRREFDIVVYSHVLEHLPEPLEEMRRVHDVIVPGGMIYIEAPSLGYIFSRAYMGDLQRYLQLAHLYHFSSGTLEATMRAAGFAPIRRDWRIRSVWRRLARPDPSARPDEYHPTLRYLRFLEACYPVSKFLTGLRLRSRLDAILSMFR